MSVLATETQNKVGSCRAALQSVEKHLEPLLNKSLPEVTRKLAPLENAELQVGLAYTVASLYFCNLLTQGVDPSEHPIRQELDRIQLYFKKVRTTADEVREKQAESARVRVDGEAAKRIVQHYTGAADAASQRRNVSEQASSSSAGLAPHPVQPDAPEEGSPKKRRKTGDASDGGAAAMEGVTAETPKKDSSASASAVPPETPKATPPPAAVKSPPPLVEKAAALSPSSPKPPPPLLKAPAVKASIVKAPPPSPTKVTPSGKAAVAKVSPPKIGDAHSAQLRPLAKPMPSAAAKTPQGPAADAILALAKADATAHAQKKKKKKAQKSLAAAASAPAAAATTAAASPVASSPGPAEEDPYGAAVVEDPYA